MSARPGRFDNFGAAIATMRRAVRARLAAKWPTVLVLAGLIERHGALTPDDAAFALSGGAPRRTAA